jgi:hypothetical protein
VGAKAKVVALSKRSVSNFAIPDPAIDKTARTSTAKTPPPRKAKANEGEAILLSARVRVRVAIDRLPRVKGRVSVLEAERETKLREFVGFSNRELAIKEIIVHFLTISQPRLPKVKTKTRIRTKINNKTTAKKTVQLQKPKVKRKQLQPLQDPLC